MKMMTSNWWTEDWYQEWLRLSKRDYHNSKPKGFWVCYYNDKNQIIYEFVDM